MKYGMYPKGCPMQWDTDTMSWVGVPVEHREAWEPMCTAAGTTVDAQLAAAGKWLQADPARAKKKRNMVRFFANWVSRMKCEHKNEGIVGW